MLLHPHDPGYPQRALDLDEPPKLTVSAPLQTDRRVIAIVGSRDAGDGARDWAHRIAYYLARQGIIVASGGADGIDAAAHLGALTGGTTWCIACCGRGVVFPPKNGALFERIEASSTSRMIWPFADGVPKDDHTPRLRNGVLVSLAHEVVVIQAAAQSGSRNAARLANDLRRPLYVATGRPWDWEFQGSHAHILGGARPLFSLEQLFRELQLPEPDLDDPNAHFCGRPPPQLPIRSNKRRAPKIPKPPLKLPFDDTLTTDEKHVKTLLSRAPTQQDKILAKSSLPTSTTLTALLTLSLKDVVVEAPDGYFRLRN